MAREDLKRPMNSSVEARVREGAKAIPEEVPKEEMTAHLMAGYRELTSARGGGHSGHYVRNLAAPAVTNRVVVGRVRKVPTLQLKWKRVDGECRIHWASVPPGPFQYATRSYKAAGNPAAMVRSDAIILTVLGIDLLSAQDVRVAPRPLNAPLILEGDSTDVSGKNTL